MREKGSNRFICPLETSLSSQDRCRKHRGYKPDRECLREGNYGIRPRPVVEPLQLARQLCRLRDFLIAGTRIFRPRDHAGRIPLPKVWKNFEIEDLKCHHVTG